MFLEKSCVRKTAWSNGSVTDTKSIHFVNRIEPAEPKWLSRDLTFTALHTQSRVRVPPILAILAIKKSEGVIPEVKRSPEVQNGSISRPHKKDFCPPKLQKEEKTESNEDIHDADQRLIICATNRILIKRTKELLHVFCL